MFLYRFRRIKVDFLSVVGELFKVADSLTAFVCSS